MWPLWLQKFINMQVSVTVCSELRHRRKVQQVAVANNNNSNSNNGAKVSNAIEMPKGGSSWCC